MSKKLAMKVAASWAAIAYAVCYAAVALVPGLREWFFEYALHARVEVGENVMSFGNFAYGLVFWVALAAIGGWLLAVLVNSFRK